MGNLNAEKAIYDITSQSEYISNLSLPEGKLLSVEKLKKDKTVQIKEERDYTKLFKYFIVTVALLLVAVIIIKLKKNE